MFHMLFHVSFNSNTILKSFQNFHIILHRGELCSIFLLKSVLASQDISQGVSHPEKVHMVFTWTSHTFHRVAPSSEGFRRVYKNTNCAFLIFNSGRDFVIQTSKSISSGLMLA